MKNDKVLVVLVIILSILVLGFSGYIVYDKVLSPNNNSEREENNIKEDSVINDNNVENNISIDYNELKKELEESFGVTYDYYNEVGPYCGEGWEFTSEVLIGDNNFGSNISQQFKTYDEMIDYLKLYMTEEVIGKKSVFNAMDKNWYLEKDGKLYCQNSAKGGSYLNGMSSIIKTSMQINTLSEDKVEANVINVLSSTNSDTTFYDYNEIDVTFEKLNNNWIVTSFTYDILK